MKKILVLIVVSVVKIINKLLKVLARIEIKLVAKKNLFKIIF